MAGPYGRVDLFSAGCLRAQPAVSPGLPGVVTLTRHPQQPRHPDDLEVRLLLRHQLKPFDPGGFDAKKGLICR